MWQGFFSYVRNSLTEIRAGFVDVPDNMATVGTTFKVCAGPPESRETRKNGPMDDAEYIL